jgi:hypothetical protein
MNALRDLRMFAIREALDETVGSDRLIDAALRAIIEGVESPSLPLLAGLSRRDEGEAHGLFREVVAELDLAPPMPRDDRAVRWTLMRLLCEAITDGSAEPEIAARSIWYQGWNELEAPDALQGIVGWVSEWEDWDPSWDVDREHFRRLIVSEAQALLSGPWPPE